MGFLMNLLFGKKEESRANERSMEYPIKNDIICEKYKVKGKYPGTGRIRTVEVVAWDHATEDELLKRVGLTEPYEIEKIGFNKPTEKQIEYAQNTNVFIPTDATKDDVSIFLTRMEESEPIRQPKANPEILGILIKQLGLYIPSYAGNKEMDAYFRWYGLKTDEDKYAYFAMKVYAQTTGKNYRFMHEANQSERERFYKFANTYKDNRSFIESYGRYEPEEITITGKIKRKLKAYEIANAFFYENL